MLLLHLPPSLRLQLLLFLSCPNIDIVLGILFGQALLHPGDHVQDIEVGGSGIVGTLGTTAAKALFAVSYTHLTLPTICSV